MNQETRDVYVMAKRQLQLAGSALSGKLLLRLVMGARSQYADVTMRREYAGP